MADETTPCPEDHCPACFTAGQKVRLGIDHSCPICRNRYRPVREQSARERRYSEAEAIEREAEDEEAWLGRFR